MNHNCKPKWIIYFTCMVLAVLTTVLTASCAVLPEVRYQSGSSATAEQPTMTNAQGTLSAKKSRTLLAKRWSNSQMQAATLAAMAAREEAATGAPLIAGNKITLLYDGRR